MPDLLQILTDLSWPVAICIAWLAGEYGQRWTGLPKISFYGIAGFSARLVADRRAAANGFRHRAGHGRRRPSA